MVIIMFAAASVCASQQAPQEIAGFVLGKNIEAYSDRLKMGSVLPLRYAPFLKEVEIRNLEGYKSGLVNFGVCENLGSIIRIKLKYEDSSEKFFSELLKRFKQRFGEPDEWRGDPFHVVLAWKWSFLSEDGKRTTLTLQHNTRDTDEKIGNTVKIARLDLEMAERRCHEKKYPESVRPEKNPAGKAMQGKDVDWEKYLPR
jgi:hypothetical protein